MKQLTLLLFLLLSAFNLNSQDYVPMAVDSATWIMTYTDENPDVFELVVLRIEGDTMVNNVSYSKIYHYEYVENAILIKTRKLLGLLRDNLNEKKVYGGFLNQMQDELHTFLNSKAQCNWSNSNSFNEYLLYDFNVIEGDTINSCMLNEPIEIIDIDSIDRFGFKRRNLNFGDEESTIMTEGIGTCIGIFKGQACLFTGSGYSYHLSNYCIGPFSNCNLITSTKDQIKKSQFAISPNPVLDILRIKNTSNLKNISLFNSQGRLIKRFSNVSRIDMSSLHSGIYYFRFQDKTGRIYSEIVNKI